MDAGWAEFRGTLFCLTKQSISLKGGVLMIVFNLLNLLIDNFLTFYIEQHAAQSIILPAYIYHTVVVMFTDQHAALHII